MKRVPQTIWDEAMTLGYEIVSREPLGMHMFNLERVETRDGLVGWRRAFGATFEQKGYRAYYSQSARTALMGRTKFVKFMAAFKSCANESELVTFGGQDGHEA